MSGRSYVYQPVLDRRPDNQTPRERAEFLAHEIFHDRLAPESEIADAIEAEIKRFAAIEIVQARAFRAVVEVRRGPLKTHRNGTTAYAWALVVLSCGHSMTYERLRNPRLEAPARVRCPNCRL